ADQTDRALMLLLPLRRDLPHDVQVLLALSRALLGAERWSLAEEALTELLAHNAGDPEALKGLAMLAMRRGELDRAREYVRHALEVDPVDEEALLLEAELGQKRATLESETRDDFVQALVAQLAVQSTPHLLQSRHLIVRLGQGGVAR